MSEKKKPKGKSKKEDVLTSEIINYYTLPEVQAFETKSHNPNYDVHGLKIPLRMLIVGASGSGKTNILMNLMKMFNGTFNYIDIYTRCKAEPLYEYLESKIDKQFLTIYEGLDQFNKLDPNKVYDPEMQRLIIFDDMVMEKNQTKIAELFIRGRKLGGSIIYLSQSYFQVPKTIRAQLSYIILRKVSSTKDINMILRDSSLGVDGQVLNAIYKACTQQLTDFLLIDLFAPQDKTFRYNLDMVIDVDQFIASL